METLTEKSDTLIKLYDDNVGSYRFICKDKGLNKSLEAIEDMLLKLGLSKNESRVYLFLARSKERKASEISQALLLHRTETYRILRDLEKRGLVSSIFEKPLKFIATPFEKAVEILIEAKKMRLRLLEKRKKDLVDLWFSLPRPESEPERKDVFQILEGEEQINLKADEILERTQEEILVFAQKDEIARLYHSGFLEKLEKCSKKEFEVKLLTDDSPKSHFFLGKIKLDSKSVSRVEGLPAFIISDDEELLLVIKKSNDNNEDEMKRRRNKTMALWTNYEAFIKTLQTLFLHLWCMENPVTLKEASIKA